MRAPIAAHCHASTPTPRQQARLRQTSHGPGDRPHGQCPGPRAAATRHALGLGLERRRRLPTAGAPATASTRQAPCPVAAGRGSRMAALAVTIRLYCTKFPAIVMQAPPFDHEAAMLPSAQRTLGFALLLAAAQVSAALQRIQHAAQVRSSGTDGTGHVCMARENAADPSCAVFPKPGSQRHAGGPTTKDIVTY